MGGGIKCKDSIGNTYRVLEYKSTSISSSDSYLTTAVNSDGLSNTTALTRSSTSGESYLTRSSTSGTSYLTSLRATDRRFIYSRIDYGTSHYKYTRTQTGTNIQTMEVKNVTVSSSIRGNVFLTCSIQGTSRSVNEYDNTVTYGYISYYDKRTTTYTGAGSSGQWGNETTYYVGNAWATSYGPMASTVTLTSMLYYGASLTWNTAVNTIINTRYYSSNNDSPTADTRDIRITLQMKIVSDIATTGTSYLTRSSTSSTIYLTRSSTSGYSGKSSSSKSIQTSSWL